MKAKITSPILVLTALCATSVCVPRALAQDVAPARRAPKIADAITQQMRSGSWLGDAAYAEMLRLRLAHLVVATGVGYGNNNCLVLPNENLVSQKEVESIRSQLEAATQNRFVRSALPNNLTGAKLRPMDVQLKQETPAQVERRIQLLQKRHALLSQIIKHLQRRVTLLRTYKPNSPQVKAEDATIAKLNKQLRSLQAQDRPQPRYQLLGN